MLVALLTNAGPVYCQGRDIFGSQELTRQLKKKYKLSRSEITRLTPLIRLENIDVTSLYLRYSLDEPDYSQKIWNEIVERRRDVIDRSNDGLLSDRQRRVVADARSTLERRMLILLVEDYVDFLASILDLSDWQADELELILTKDRERKEFLLRKHLTNVRVLFDEFSTVTKDSQNRIERLLEPDQIRAYRLLSTPAKPLIS